MRKDPGEKLTEKIYLPKEEISIQRLNPYFSLTEVGTNSNSTKHSSSLMKNYSTVGDYESRSHPIRAANVFSQFNASTQKAEIQLLKERIDREYEELNGRMSATDVSGATNLPQGYPKDSSGGNNNSAEQFRGTSSLPAVGMPGSHSQVGADLKSRVRSPLAFEGMLGPSPRLDRHRFVERLPLHASIGRKPFAEDANANLQPRPSASRYPGQVGDHARSYSLVEGKQTSKNGAWDHRQNNLAEMIIIEGQSEFSGNQETSPRRSPEAAPLPVPKVSVAEKIERFALEVEIAEIDRAIEEKTRVIVESKSLADVIRISSEEMVRARQSEISYMETKHKQRLELLHQQLQFERLKFEQLSHSLGLPSKNDTLLSHK